MKMNSSEWIHCFFLPLYTAVCIIEGYHAEWLSRPGTLQTCLHDDAVFNWTYNATSAPDISIITWYQYSPPYDTVLQCKITSDELYTCKYNTGRVHLLPGANAGIVIENVTEADERPYLVQIPEARLNDTAWLRVFTESELRPTLSVNNIAVDFDEMIVPASDKVTVSLITASALAADINISVHGELTTCRQRTNCVAVIPLDNFKQTEHTVTFSLDYHVCGVLTYSIKLQPDMEDYEEQNITISTSQDKNAASHVGIFIPIVVVLGVGSIILMICCLHHKYKGSRELQGGNERNTDLEEEWTVVKYPVNSSKYAQDNSDTNSSYSSLMTLHNDDSSV